MEREYVTKRITIDVDFHKSFTPPEKYEEATWGNNFTSACQGCPLLHWDDDTADNYCIIGGDDECPIKKYF